MEAIKWSLLHCFFLVLFSAILLPYLQQIKYNTCWVLSFWTNYQPNWFENCVNDGYLYWENNLDSNTHKEVNIDLDCPQIDVETLFAIPVEKRHEFFQQLTSNGEQPLQIKNGVSYFTNETFNIKYFLNKLKNLSYTDGCVTKLVNNVTGSVNDENFSLGEYIENIHNMTGLFTGDHRASLLNIEDILPDLTATLVNDELLHTIFGENYKSKRLIHDSKTQSSELMIGLAKAEEKNKRRFHADLFTVINFQLYGVKEWILVPSQYLFQFRPDISDSRIQTDFNLVDKKPLNWDKIPRMHCTMEKNDILYVPIAYLHKVDYIDLSRQSDFSISLLAMYLDYYQLLQNHWQTAIGMLKKTQSVRKFCQFVE